MTQTTLRGSKILRWAKVTAYVFVIALLMLSPGATPAYMTVPAQHRIFGVNGYNMSLADALGQLFGQSGAQYTIDNDVRSRVTVSAMNMPFRKALLSILHASSTPIRCCIHRGVYRFSKASLCTKWRPPYWIFVVKHAYKVQHREGISAKLARVDGLCIVEASRIYAPWRGPKGPSLPCPPVPTYFDGTVVVVPLHRLHKVKLVVQHPWQKHDKTHFVNLKCVPPLESVPVRFVTKGAKMWRAPDRLTWRDTSGRRLIVFTGL